MKTETRQGDVAWNETGARAAENTIGRSEDLLIGVAGTLLWAPAPGRGTGRRIIEIPNDAEDRTDALADPAGETPKDQVRIARTPAFRQAQDTVTSRSSAPNSTK